jgi:hypothetical protein
MAREKLQVLSELEKALKLVDKDKVSVGVWALGTVVCHKLNIGGFINWLGQPTDTIETGLPYPFSRRRRFPWETGDKPDWEDKICEWGIPMMASWLLVYHPEAVANFVDALIPF